jgi:hypothetical protein
MLTGIRNGRPEGHWYKYRGTGEDIMPWADSGDGSVDYVAGGELRRRGKTWCPGCGYGFKSRTHRVVCLEDER